MPASVTATGRVGTRLQVDTNWTESSADFTVDVVGLE
jgi:hypothetical protein